MWLLPKLYETIIPISVLNEVRFYENLPDAVEIVAATRTWLKVFHVERTERVKNLRTMGLGKGEAEALVLYEESKADFLLLTDEDAIRKARGLGAKAIDLADVGREAYQTRALNAQQLLTYATSFP
jgi:predicted nucleic acid-binding protein